MTRDLPTGGSRWGTRRRTAQVVTRSRRRRRPGRTSTGSRDRLGRSARRQRRGRRRSSGTSRRGGPGSRSRCRGGPRGWCRCQGRGRRGTGDRRLGDGGVLVLAGMTPVPVRRVVARHRLAEHQQRAAGVDTVDDDVAQQSAVPVAILVGGLEHDGLAEGHLGQRRGGRVSAAVAALGCVDPDEAHTLAVVQVEGVAVDDVDDDVRRHHRRRNGRRGWGRLGGRDGRRGGHRLRDRRGLGRLGDRRRRGGRRCRGGRGLRRRGRRGDRGRLGAGASTVASTVSAIGLTAAAASGSAALPQAVRATAVSAARAARTAMVFVFVGGVVEERMRRIGVVHLWCRGRSCRSNRRDWPGLPRWERTRAFPGLRWTQVSRLPGGSARHSPAR